MVRSACMPRPAPNSPKYLLALVLGFAATLHAGCGDHVSDLDVQNATLPEVRALVQEKPGAARLIDTRAPGDYAAGRIPGAVSLDLDQVSEKKDSIDPALAR